MALGLSWTAVQLLLDWFMVRASTSPEVLLEKALMADSARARAKYATRGLSHPSLEVDTQAMLLRQLYLAHLESERFDEARAVAEQAIALGVLVEPAYHDAARACIAVGDLRGAVGHLRMASRRAPAHRRSLHLWTLGRVLFFEGRYSEALAAFTRALRWATENQALYRAHVALARRHRGEDVDLRLAYEALGASSPLPLYAEFLGAQLLRFLGEPRLAITLLRQFLKQVADAPLEVSVGLLAEVRLARSWLDADVPRMAD